MADSNLPQPPPGESLSQEALDALAERELMRKVAMGLPLLTLLGAFGVGAATSFGPAILVVAGGLLLGVIMLLWSSLRTLGGEIPLPPDLVSAMVLARGSKDSLAEKKRMTLRALKDLEHEFSIGKVDETDYKELASKLRAEAKSVLQQMDQSLDDRRPEAERMAQAYLAKRGLSSNPTEAAPSASTKATSASSPPSAISAPASSFSSTSSADAPVDHDKPTTDATTEARLPCPSCGATNERDAKFCKACGARMGSEEAAS